MIYQVKCIFQINLNVFNMIAAINEYKTLIKHISCSSRCKFDGKKCNYIKSVIIRIVDVSLKNQ